MEFSDLFSSVAKELCYYEADRNTAKMPVNPSLTGYCAAYMLCKKYGVDAHGFDFSRAPDVFNGLEPMEVKQELSIIRDAAEIIAGRMSRQLSAEQKEASKGAAEKPSRDLAQSAPPKEAR